MTNCAKKKKQTQTEWGESIAAIINMMTVFLDYPNECERTDNREEI